MESKKDFINYLDGDDHDHAPILPRKEITLIKDNFDDKNKIYNLIINSIYCGYEKKIYLLDCYFKIKRLEE